MTTGKKITDHEIMGLCILLALEDHAIRELDLTSEITELEQCQHNRNINCDLWSIENKITCEGAKMLSGWLKKNTTLTVLKLGRETMTFR